LKEHKRLVKVSPRRQTMYKKKKKCLRAAGGGGRKNLAVSKRLPTRVKNWQGTATSQDVRNQSKPFEGWFSNALLKKKNALVLEKVSNVQSDSILGKREERRVLVETGKKRTGGIDEFGESKTYTRMPGY